MDSYRISKRELVTMFHKKIQKKARENNAYKFLTECTQADLNNLLDVFEEVVYDNLKTATETKSIVVPLFEGMIVEGVRTPQTTRRNNLTGKIITVATKIKPKATFTRTCIDKLSQELK